MSKLFNNISLPEADVEHVQYLLKFYDVSLDKLNLTLPRVVYHHYTEMQDASDYFAFPVTGFDVSAACEFYAYNVDLDRISKYLEKYDQEETYETRPDIMLQYVYWSKLGIDYLKIRREILEFRKRLNDVDTQYYHVPSLVNHACRMTLYDGWYSFDEYHDAKQNITSYTIAGHTNAYDMHCRYDTKDHYSIINEFNDESLIYILDFVIAGYDMSELVVAFDQFNYLADMYESDESQYYADEFEDEEEAFYYAQYYGYNDRHTAYEELNEIMQKLLLLIDSRLDVDRTYAKITEFVNSCEAINTLDPSSIAAEIVKLKGTRNLVLSQ